MSGSPRGAKGEDSTLKSTGLRIGATITRWAAAVRNYFAAVASFYTQHVQQLREHFTEWAVGPPSAKVRRREIRLSAYVRRVNAWHDTDGWHVELPDCCAVCGRPTDRESVVAAYSVMNPAVPFWSPIGGFVAGFVLMLITRWFWMWPLGILAGFLFGYEYQQCERAVVRFRRCQQHADVAAIPYLRRFRELLIVRVGHPDVRRQFFHKDAGTELFQTNLDPPATDRSTMPLEEHGGETVITPDDRPRLAGYSGPLEKLPLRGSTGETAERPPAKSAPHHEPQTPPPGPDEGPWGKTMPLAGDEKEQNQSNNPEQEIGPVQP